MEDKEEEDEEGETITMINHVARWGIAVASVG
eukprot:COSAG06_NODE_6291_length_2995_cov_95.512605_7_plen_32_part_00